MFLKVIFDNFSNHALSHSIWYETNFFKYVFLIFSKRNLKENAKNFIFQVCDIFLQLSKVKFYTLHFEYQTLKIETRAIRKTAKNYCPLGGGNFACFKKLSSTLWNRVSRAFADTRNLRSVFACSTAESDFSWLRFRTRKNSMGSRRCETSGSRA